MCSELDECEKNGSVVNAKIVINIDKINGINAKHTQSQDQICIRKKKWWNEIVSFGGFLLSSPRDNQIKHILTLHTEKNYFLFRKQNRPYFNFRSLNLNETTSRLDRNLFNIKIKRKKYEKKKKIDQKKMNQNCNGVGFSQFLAQI